MSVFDEVAALYDEIRPGYTPEIVDAVVEMAALPPGGRILEVGCGTGQITLPLAARGYAIVALEPGPALAEFAAAYCLSYARVRVVPSTFEAWTPEPALFDLVLGAQSFHWVAPETACEKAARVLRPGGALAVVFYVDRSEDTAFWRATEPTYDRHLPAASPPRPSIADHLDRYREALTASPLFTGVEERRHRWHRDYKGDAWLKMLQTFSDYRTMPEPGRTEFFTAIARVVAQFDGVVRRHYETVVLVAHRKRTETR